MIKPIDKIIKSRHFYPVLLILLLGLVVFSWFSSNLIFSYGDVRFNFNPQGTWSNYFHGWGEEGVGSSSIQAIPFIFYETTLALWSYIGLPLFLFQRLVYYLLFVIGGLSVYFLVITLVKDRRRYLAGTIAALFYMFNSFALI